MGVIQRRDGLRFTSEAFAELRGGDFDRNVAIQSRISGPIHLTHASSTDGRKDFVRAEFVAYRKRHVSESVKFSGSNSN